jgi:hypothetical protein
MVIEYGQVVLPSIVQTDRVIRIDPATTPNYNSQNPLFKLLGMLEAAQLAAEREYYLTEQLQYLFPFAELEMYGPAGADYTVLDPARQDNKTDFQKQNVHDFRATDTYLLRGWVQIEDTSFPFLRLSYRGGPDSLLSQVAHRHLGESSG